MAKGKKAVKKAKKVKKAPFTIGVGRATGESKKGHQYEWTKADFQDKAAMVHRVMELLKQVGENDHIREVLVVVRPA